MARLVGVDLPRNKRIEIALTYIYGIGLTTAKEIIAATGVDPDIRVKDLPRKTSRSCAITSSRTSRSKVTCIARFLRT